MAATLAEVKADAANLTPEEKRDLVVGLRNRRATGVAPSFGLLFS
jgi:hypothetical protein